MPISFFDAYKAIDTKETKPEHHSEYDGIVWNINAWLSFDATYTDSIAWLSRYIGVLKGRYYILLYNLFPKSNRFVKWIKNDTLESIERFQVQAIQRTMNYNGHQAYIARELLIQKGVDLVKLFGEPPKEDKKKKK